MTHSICYFAILLIDVFNLIDEKTKDVALMFIYFSIKNNKTFSRRIYIKNIFHLKFFLEKKTYFFNWLISSYI